MINENGIFDVLTLDTAIKNQIALAAAAGITVASGSVESQFADLLAQNDVYLDTKEYQSYQLQFNPVGSDIDLQNPGTPRKPASISQGPLDFTNPTGSPIVVTANSIFTAPNGNTYTTATNTVAVAASGGTAGITVFSVATGIAQNLPNGQSFTSSYTGLLAVNPQPFTTGRNIETDTEYLTRIISLQTNNSSQQATNAATKELEVFYPAALFYVNNGANTLPDPVPVPPNGYIAIVKFPSGVTPNSAELQNAFQVIANRLEFGNAFRNSTALHPVLSGVVYTGNFPQTYYIVPAQVVRSIITCSVDVRFAPNVDSHEKGLLANAFAQFFAQNLISYFGGAAGNATAIFQEAGSPPLYPVSTPISVQAAIGIISPIAPAFSIEQVRALISDESELPSLPNFEYLSCTALQYVLNPLVGGQPNITLDINAPSGGTVASVDFKRDALFTDYSGWYDRYIYLDPSLITINLLEVP